MRGYEADLMDMSIGRITAELKKRTGGRRVFALMSGGVDSSVAAMLAQRSGALLTGVVMRTSEDQATVEAAQRACDRLRIECLAVDMRREFAELVEDRFTRDYENGLTPNPCVLCNRDVKFGALWDAVARHVNDDSFLVLSGHYAVTGLFRSSAVLRRGRDEKKDQSYFLCMLPLARLGRLLTPLGSLLKSQTREIARSSGELPTELADKPESMEVCFLQGRDYRQALRGEDQPGAILSPDGRRLGSHRGLRNYTIGQRKGLGIASPEPLYVTGFLPDENALVAAPRSEALAAHFTAAELNILSRTALARRSGLTGKIRSQSAPAPLQIIRRRMDSITVKFEKPQLPTAAGQYLAIYQGDRLVAGAMITGSGS